MPQGTVEHMVPFPGGKGVMCVCTGVEELSKKSSGVTACALSLPTLQITATFEYLQTGISGGKKRRKKKEKKMLVSQFHKS
jgi:hypothetical protein